MKRALAALLVSGAIVVAIGADAAPVPTSTLFKAVDWRAMSSNGIVLLPVVEGGQVTSWIARATVCLKPDPTKVSGPMPELCQPGVVTITPTSQQNTYLKSLVRSVIAAAGGASDTP